MLHCFSFLFRKHVGNYISHKVIVQGTSQNEQKVHVTRVQTKTTDQ